ncbi:hypothetical protein ACHAWF_003178 [Thalassiosira exigua]
MSLTEAAHIAVVDLGTPPASGANGITAKEWESVDVRFHGFRDLDTARGHCISSRFQCVGNVWELRVFPRGGIRSEGGMVGISLAHLDHNEIRVQFSISIEGENRKMHRYYSSQSQATWTRFYSGGRCWNRRDFVSTSRTDIINALVDGTLVIEVRMCAKADGSAPTEPAPPKPFVAENPLPGLIIEKFMDEESSDLMIEVTSTSESATTDTKKTNTSATFHAHQFILQQCASALGDLCKTGEDLTPVRISDLGPEIFRHLLYYAYGGKIDDDELKESAKDIIDAADKFGVVGLKLEAEASYVSSMDVTIDNVMDNLLYADAKNCALMKETVMDFLVKNRKEAWDKLSFVNAPGSLMKDLLAAIDMSSLNDNAGADSNDFASMGVCTLRKMLHEKGLPIDGSREAMLTLLREHSSNSDV